jgi:hypothetical protein
VALICQCITASMEKHMGVGFETKLEAAIPTYRLTIAALLISLVDGA